MKGFINCIWCAACIQLLVKAFVLIVEGMVLLEGWCILGLFFRRGRFLEWVGAYLEGVFIRGVGLVVQFY